MAFRLRHLQHNLELSQGEFFIGRSAECQLALDDPLVSRKHALLMVGSESVIIKDLGSRNGIVVNGTKIDSSRVLLDGDRIVIGSQELTVILSRLRRPGEGTPAARRAVTQTLSSVAPARGGVSASEGLRGGVMTSEPPRSRAPASVPTGGTMSEPPAESTSRRIDAFPVLSTLADKAFALGHADDAERILAPLMMDLLAAVRDNMASQTDGTIDRVAHYGVRFAAASGKGSWVDYVVQLYSAVRRPCPAALVEELHSVLRKTSGIDIQALRSYLDVLRESLEMFGPAQRFLVQRIEGLERLASLK
jgi:pSer/pThr/pTyr-binding forkhead associated (FHA) protein